MLGFRLIVVSLAILLSSPLARASVTLPALVSDGMVLQQKAPVRILWNKDGLPATPFRTEPQ